MKMEQEMVNVPRNIPDNSTLDSGTDPEYYRRCQVECIDVIEALALPFHLGNVLKYLWRWDKKGGLVDLKKARWYLDRHIKLMESERFVVKTIGRKK